MTVNAPRIHQPRNTPNNHVGGQSTTVQNEGGFNDIGYGVLNRAAQRNLFTVPPQAVGIGNVWTIGIVWSTGNLGSTYVLLDIGASSGDVNRIQIQHQGAVANDPLQVQLYDNAGVNFKTYTYNTFINNVGLLQQGHYSVITWDGTTLKAYSDGVLKTATGTAVDLSGTMDDTNNRVVSAGGSTAGASQLLGNMSVVQLWNSVLSANEIAQLWAGFGHQHDPRKNHGDYVSSANLVHFWNLGGSTDITDSGNFIVCPDLVDNWTMGGNGSDFVAGNPPNRSSNTFTMSNVGGSTLCRPYMDCFTSTTARYGSSTQRILGFGNAWTYHAILNRQATTAADWPIFNVGNTSNNNDEIWIGKAGTVSATKPIRIKLYNSSGTLFKQYNWINIDEDPFNLATPASVPDAGIWTMLDITWDGTNLKLYKNGQIVPPTSIDTDNSGSQADTSRAICFGASKAFASPSYRAYFIETAVWDSALQAREIEALWDNGNTCVDLNVNSGSYGSADNLLFWNRPIQQGSLGPTSSSTLLCNAAKYGTIDSAQSLANITITNIHSARRNGYGCSMLFKGGQRLTAASASKIGITNDWAICWWQYTNTAGTGSQDQVILDIGSNGGAGGPNAIEIRYTDAATDFLQVRLWDSNGVLFKDFRYNGYISAANSTWKFTTIIWNASTLSVYANQGISANAASSTPTNNSGTMTDTERVISFGASPDGTNPILGAFIPWIAVWGDDTGLATASNSLGGTAGTRYEIMMGKNFDMRYGQPGSNPTSSGGYNTPLANILKHWYWPGRIISNPGHDFAIAGTKIPLVPYLNHTDIHRHGVT